MPNTISTEAQILAWIQINHPFNVFKCMQIYMYMQYIQNRPYCFQQIKVEAVAGSQLICQAVALPNKVTFCPTQR